MDQQQTHPDTEPRLVFPSPPNVHWGVLFGAQIVVAVVACFLVPRGYWSLVSNLAFDAWAIYLCLWIRKLEPDAMSLFWCVACVALQVSFNVPSASAPAHNGVTILAGVLAALCLAMWLVTIYVVRAELHFHYNEREPIGLYLSGVMTFFFSFLYFQYHLYKIAQLRERNGNRPFYYQGGPPLTLPDL
ncbi:MAG TPA: hypothetical protein VGG56_15380 [Terracidiphilus sp.]|jgi:hypothetical protein